MENLETAPLPSHPVEARRLDSLARLFEANMTCAVVCLIGKTLYIITNDIYAYPTKATQKLDSQKIKYLKKATRHFLSKTFREDKAFHDVDIDILYANCKGKIATHYKGQGGAPELEEEDIKSSTSELYNG